MEKMMEGSYIPSGLGRPSDPPGGAGGRGLSLKFYFYQSTSQPSPSRHEQAEEPSH